MAHNLLVAKSALQAARTDADHLKASLRAGQTARVKSELADLRRHARTADGALGGPLWGVASHLPVVGDDVAAVRTISGALDELSTRALPDLVDLYSELSGDTFRPVGGRVDTAPLRAAQPALQRSLAALQGPADRVARINTDDVMGALRGPVAAAQSALGEAASALNRADIAARVLPAAMEGTHTYLVLFQNPAEIRATGGMPGSWAELRVRDGKISLGKQGATAQQLLPTSPSTLTADEVKYYGPNLGRDLRDVAFTPHFPRVAQLAEAIVGKNTGIKFDGVLAVDAVALGYLLDATGPVDLSDGHQITSRNAAAELLNGVYLRTPDPEKQDAIFNQVVKTVFAKISAGKFNANRAVPALVKGGEQRRLLVWFNNPTLNKPIDGTMIAGQLPTTQNPPAYGIYFNDATGAKLEYYLDVDADTSVTCVAGNAQRYDTTLTFHSRAPKNAARLPVAVRGPGFGTPPGDIYFNVDIVSPMGGSLPSITQNGTAPTYFRLRVEGRTTARLTVGLKPGQTQTYEISTLSAPGADGDTTYAVTPTIRSGTQPSVLSSACQ